MSSILDGSVADHFLRDFVFRDRRLGDNPSVVAGIRIARLEFGGASETVVATSREPLGSFPRIPIPNAGPIVMAWMHTLRSDGSIDRFAPPPVVASAADPAGLPPIGRSNIGVPFFSEGQATALLFLCHLQSGHFSDEEIRQMQLLAQILEICLGGLSRTARQVGIALRGVRERGGVSSELLAVRMDQTRANISRWEAGAEIPSARALYEWCKALGLVASAGTAVVTVVEVTPRLLEILREDPEILCRLTPSQFEQFVANRLDQMGYAVTLTGSTNRRDGGIDLIAVPKIRTVGSFLLAGQVKHHADPSLKTGSDAVQKFLAWKNSYFQLGLLITNTAFTRDAVWLASEERNRHFLRLRGIEDLRRWLQDNYGSEQDWREIPKEIVLAPGITVDVPKPTLLDALPRISPFAQHSGLTPRETEVLYWVAEGKSNADIAAILTMSPATVKKHLERIFQKLGVETRTAAAMALRDRLRVGS